MITHNTRILLLAYTFLFSTSVASCTEGVYQQNGPIQTNGPTSMSIQQITATQVISPDTPGYLPPSASGKWMADSVTYPRWYGSTHPTTTEIGVTDIANGARELLCKTAQFQFTQSFSLKWSPDEQWLMWIAPESTENIAADEVTYWLWVGSRATKQCVKTVRVRTGPGHLFPGGFSAEWSPDGNSIVFIQGQEAGQNPLSGNIAILDVNTYHVRAVTKFTEETVTFVRFMPDSNDIAFSIRKGLYGEIWVIGKDGSRPYPIAGPTTIDAPFVWMPITE